MILGKIIAGSNVMVKKLKATLILWCILILWPKRIKEVLIKNVPTPRINIKIK